MIIPLKNYTHLGYDYLDKVNVTQIHSGVDLNRGRPMDDLGDPVLAMTRGEVVYAQDTGAGWGNLVVLYHPAYGCWSRYAHLDRIDVRKKSIVTEGQQIGTCGDSGATWIDRLKKKSWTPHLHFDVIIKELSSWTSYTTLWSLAKVREYYADPLKYIAETNYGEHEDEDIVKWHKDNKIIERWSTTPTPSEIREGWMIYKALRANKEKDLKFNL